MFAHLTLTLSLSSNWKRTGIAGACCLNYVICVNITIFCRNEKVHDIIRSCMNKACINAPISLSYQTDAVAMIVTVSNVSLVYIPSIQLYGFNPFPYP